MDSRLPINMLFDEKFFCEEIICDYLVTEKMKKIWAVELDLYREFSEVCIRNNIVFCVFAGTLLGAVRHKGFIPWDDDFDICMDRENYNKLLSVADEFKNPYFLQHALNDREYFFGYARLRNSDTTGIVIENKSVNYNNGIYIDIFVLDGYVDDETLLKRQMLKKDLWERLIYEYYVNLSKYKGLKKVVHKCLQVFTRFIWSYDELVSKYSNVISCYTDRSDRVGIVTHPTYMLKKYWMSKLSLSDLVWVEYENLKVPIPKDWDSVLKNIFGDYMEFPSVESRGVWHENMLILDPDISYRDYIYINGL